MNGSASWLSSSVQNRVFAGTCRSFFRIVSRFPETTSWGKATSLQIRLVPYMLHAALVLWRGLYLQDFSRTAHAYLPGSYAVVYKGLDRKASRAAPGYLGVSLNEGYHFAGPQNKDHRIRGIYDLRFWSRCLVSCLNANNARGGLCQQFGRDFLYR